VPQEDLLQLTEHHRSPVSLNRKVKDNPIYIFDGVQKAWHYLFMNMPPELALREIIRHWLPSKDLSLVVTIRTKYWSGDATPDPYQRFVSLKKQQAFRLVFPTQSTKEILQLWVSQWVPPPDYFQSLDVRSTHGNYQLRADSTDAELDAIILYRQQSKLIAMMAGEKVV